MSSPGADLGAVLDLQARAVEDLVLLDRARRLLVHRSIEAGAGDHDDLALAVLDRADVLELDGPALRRDRLRALRHARGRAADVERAQRQLRSRLADRLRGDDADGLADLDERPVALFMP